MTVEITGNEIEEIIHWLMGDAMATLFSNSITINDHIEFVYKLPVVGNVDIQMALSASNGEAIINITKAQIHGLSLFGEIRKKAGDIILEVLAKYPQFISAYKNNLGNISVQVKGATVSDVKIVGNNISLSLAL